MARYKVCPECDGYGETRTFDPGTLNYTIANCRLCRGARVVWDRERPACEPPRSEDYTLLPERDHPLPGLMMGM